MNFILIALSFAALCFMPSWNEVSTTAKLAGCAVILLLVPCRKFHIGLAGLFFLAWLVWSFFSCWFSEYPAQAFYGFHMRYEGEITWVILTAFALIYWQYTKTLFSMFFIMAIISIFLTELMIACPEPVWAAAFYPALVISCFCAIGISIAASYAFGLEMLFVPCLLFAVSRAGIAATMVGLLVAYFAKIKPRLFCWIIVGVGLLMVVSPIGRKIANFNFDSWGTGSRSQWIQQAHEYGLRLPIFGFGLDTQGHCLKTAMGATCDVGKIADRVHFLPLDILLQTGWIGLTLALLSFGAAVATTVKFPTQLNRGCLAGIVAWIVFGCLNPQGIPSHCVMLVCLFGIRRNL